MSEHPTPAELEGLVRGDLTREQARSVVRHLLHGCETCVAAIAPYAFMLLDAAGLGRVGGQPAHDSGHPAPPAAPAAGDHHAVASLTALRSGRPGPGPGPVDGAGAPASRRQPAPPAPPARIAPRGGTAGEPDRTLLESAYDRAIDRAFAAVMRHGENAAQAGAKVRELLGRLTPEGLESLRQLPEELRGFAGYEALLDRSWAMRREDPKQMVKLAELASMAAAALGEEGFSAGQVEDFQARAAGELANAYRVMYRLKEANASLDAARRHFRDGSQDRLLGARLLEVEANIHGDRGELDEALVALDSALRIYRRYGDPHLAGRSLIKKGLYTSFTGCQSEAIELLTEGLEMIDPEQDGPLVLAAVHNTAFCLMESGRCREARSLLWRHLGLYEQYAGRQDRLKLRWLQAEIYAGLGDFTRAERAFTEVRQGLREAGTPHTETLVTFQLASLWLRQGREDAARDLALEAAELFLKLDISREAASALELLKSSVERSAVVTPELVGQIIQLLRETAPEEQPSLVRSA
jgi:tetratricopeptide (TPR) repeat protein